MPHPYGRKLSLSLPRRLIVDLMHASRQVPSVAMERVMSLAAVVAARQAAHPRPGWCAVFTKAYAVVTARRPELRRAYLAWPRPHLYEHPINVAAVAVERSFEGEPGVFFTHLRAPEERPLTAVDDHLRRFQSEPLETSRLYRRLLKVARLPWPLRRLAWWYALQLSGHRRARYGGTFGVSVTAGQGAGQLHLLSPLTTTLHYGLFRPDGRLPVRLTFDHRVLDGATAARALAELEAVLHGPVLAELHGLRASGAA